MSKWNKLLPKSLSAIACLILIMGGVVYAVLASQRATLQSNTIETASANLKLSTDGTTYTNSVSGFDFQNLIPGGPAVPQTGNLIYLKNVGSAVLSPTVSITSAVSNPNNVDLSQVNVILTALNGGQSQTISLQDLIDAGKNAPGQSGISINPAVKIYTFQNLEYRIQIQMDSNAAVDTAATIGNIDLSFSGTAVTP